MLFEAPPPRRHISSTPVALSPASAMLDKYLLHSETHPHLHPDALITPEGVSFNAQGGSMGNPLMHHLRRVAAGLRGDYLEPDNTLDLEEQQDASTDAAGASVNQSNKGAAAEEDWQDMASYQAEQGIEIGDMGDRTNLVQQGGEEPPVRTQDKKRKKDQAHDEQPLAKGTLDKEARKKAKKERDMQRRREKAAKGNKSE